MDLNKKLIDDTINHWNTNNKQIMESQRKYNEEAMKYSIPRLEKLRDQLP